MTIPQKISNIMNNLIICKSPELQEFSDFQFNHIINIQEKKATLLNKTINFSNILDLGAKIESLGHVFDQVKIEGGILDFSSEINIRTAFSLFYGLCHNKLVYTDKISSVKSRIDLLTRVFNALDVLPEISTSGEIITIVIKNDAKNWGGLTKKMTLEYVGRRMLSVDEFVKKIERSIIEKSPLSFMRINHCENRLLGFGYSFSTEEVNITYDIQFGYRVDNSQTIEISNQMRFAFAEADIIGVPTIKRLSSNKLHLLERNTYTNLRRFMCYENKHFTSVNIHYELGKSEKFKALLSSADKVYLITCRDLEFLESVLSREVVIIKIPGEHKFYKNDNFKNHYPSEFFNTLHVIEESVKPGNIVLIGAGILGKIYCHAVKKAGGIAIDVGSLLDAMAGVNSRGNGFLGDFWWSSKHD